MDVLRRARPVPPVGLARRSAARDTESRPGFFSSQAAASGCTACVAGRFSGATAARGRPVSVAVRADGSSPYADEFSCQPCAPGKASAALNATACPSCQPGYFQQLPGRTSCDPVKRRAPRAAGPGADEQRLIGRLVCRGLDLLSASASSFRARRPRPTARAARRAHTWSRTALLQVQRAARWEEPPSV
jgi:hypothetical protein